VAVAVDWEAVAVPVVAHRAAAAAVVALVVVELFS
jgi:hypothetical protein